MDSTNQTPNRNPTNSQKAPKRLQPCLDLDTSFGDLNWIPPVESSFGELFWRDHEFIWFYLSKHKIQLNFLDFFCQKANLIWKNMINNLLILIRLISFVKTQIQINLFEFSCQSKNSNQFAGFFLSKHRCKWIYLILPVKTQN